MWLVGIYSPGFGITTGNGQTRWDGAIQGKWPGQPDQSVGLNSSLFDPDWFDSDADDERDAAKTLIHELVHWVDIYSDGEGTRLPKREKGDKFYHDFGQYIADRVDW